VLQADLANHLLILEQPMHEPDQVPPELAPGEQVGVTFRRGHKKCMCSVTIQRMLDYMLPDGASVRAMEIPWPDQLQQMQRRLYYRAVVPMGRRIEVSLWEGDILANEPAELRQRPHHLGLLQDISAGGCRVVFDKSRDPLLHEGDTVGIQFQPDPRCEPIRIDAVFRHSEEFAQNKLSLGFQFVGLEMTAEGRHALQALSRIVSTFLRIEVRRKSARIQKNPRRQTQCPGHPRPPQGRGQYHPGQPRHPNHRRGPGPGTGPSRNRNAS
jgi:c-di-GMP-binding flagellar brake protein YcgR